jgi:hypothetical protein
VRLCPLYEARAIEQFGSQRRRAGVERMDIDREEHPSGSRGSAKSTPGSADSQFARGMSGPTGELTSPAGYPDNKAPERCSLTY